MNYEKLLAWVKDLQSGLYINCVYCGYRYGPNDKEIPADMLRRHVAGCIQHPMGKLVRACKTVLVELDQKATYAGRLSASEAMIRRQLTQAVKQAES